MKVLWLAAIVAWLGCLAPATAIAQGTYPARTIRMIIAFPPAGPTDIVSRLIAARLSEQLGQQVVVENRPGAGGNIGAELVAKATPDGYTIFYNTSAVAIAPALYTKLNFDPLRDLAPVALTATVPLVLVVNPGIPARSAREFVDYAKTRAGKFNYASSGAGVITHLAAALFCSEMGIDAVHVPYKGSAPGLVDVASGEVQFMIDTIASTLGFIRDGRLRALAVAMPKRSSLLPDVPTFHDTVLPNFEMSAWQGVMVPAGTPAPIVERLAAEVNKVIQHPDTRAKLAAQGAEPLGGTPVEYAAFIRTELVRWERAVKAAGARLE